MQNINTNIDNTYTRLEQIEDKIKENDELSKVLFEKEMELESPEKE